MAEDFVLDEFRITGRGVALAVFDETVLRVIDVALTPEQARELAGELIGWAEREEADASM